MSSLADDLKRIAGDLNRPARVPLSARMNALQYAVQGKCVRGNLSVWLGGLDSAPGCDGVASELGELLPDGVYVHHVSLRSNGEQLFYVCVLTDKYDGPGGAALYVLEVPLPDYRGRRSGKLPL